ncbi:MAG: phage major capsid protein [Casimicrobiaceae bacterium]
MADYGALASVFLSALRPLTIIGRLTGLVRAPFDERVTIQLDTAAGAWVGESLPTPVLELAFGEVTLERFKVQSLCVVSDELVRSLSAAAEAFVHNALLRANVRTIDEAFIDPTNGGISGAKPKAITNGATGFISSGNTIAAITADAKDLARQLVDLGSDLANAVWIVHPRTASFLATLPGSGGAPAFPGVSMRGGSWFGLPVISSGSVPLTNSPATTIIVLADPARILYADDDEIALDVSEQSSLQLRNDPLSGAQSLVSLWQMNLAAIKTTRRINWAAQIGSCAVLRDVSY